MKRKTLTALLAAPFALCALPSCTTTAPPQTDKERAAERRIDHQTDHIHKIQRHRRPSSN